MSIRHLSPLDRLLDSVERTLAAVVASPAAHRPSPAAELEPVELEESERRLSAGLMRVNHTGEVCAQALYLGQAAFARHENIREHLLHSADEEADHLAWCAERLQELDSRPSLLNPLWYVGSYAIGAAAAVVGDAVSLGFVMETEDQVEAHLASHLQRLPEADEPSRAIVRQMQADEVRHSLAAQQRGGIRLPFPIPGLMALTSKVMTGIAFRI